MAVNLTSQLAELRSEIVRQGLDGFVVPRADEHLGEYVPACAERLAWLTGFTGSAGFAAVLAAKAAVFTDGRYVLQLAAQTDAALWERRHIVEEPPAGWLAAAAAPGSRIGYDPLLIGEDGLRKFTDAGIVMVAVAANPLDAVWRDRPPAPRAPAYPHPLSRSGRGAAEKMTEIAAVLRAAGQDATVITDPTSIAWLLNIRGGDLDYVPVALGFAILRADASCELFMDAAKLGPETRAWLGGSVTVSEPGFALDGPLARALAGFGGCRVRVDPAQTPVWFAQRLRAAGAEVVAGEEPCLLRKACKNPVEQQGAREAQSRDAAALCRFLAWLDAEGRGSTELSAAARLLGFRKAVEGFRGESFPAISGAGEHGAIIHYRVTPETDRTLRPNELYLVDSGGQYPDGTTDVTRTVWTGPDLPPGPVRDRFTRVLQGHIAIASLVFPRGVAGPHLDAMARRALWQVGLDFDHGTGHGVGSFLSVHEGPASISRAARPLALEAGMIVSDEPGFYAPGEYGIRLENLLLVQAAELPGAVKPFLRFETLTLAPFDRRLIAPAMLTPDECRWIDDYHARVAREVAPMLGGASRSWLLAACAPLS